MVIKSGYKRFIVPGLLLIVIAALAFVVWGKKQDAQVEDERRMLQATLNAVDNHIILPANEEPTLATVEDSNLLTDPFLKKVAKQGDKILLYYTAEKVIVYRPSEDRIVDIFPLILDPSAAQAIDAKIAFRSGNGKPEDLGQIRQLLATQYPRAKLSEVLAAARQDYPTTIVIDLSEGSKVDLAIHIAKTIDAQVGILPFGEPRPEEADILILSGLE